MKKILLSVLFLALLALPAWAGQTRKLTATGVTAAGTVATTSMASGTGSVDSMDEFSLQVIGEGATPTAWDVEIQGSIDCDSSGTGNYQTLDTHVNGSQADGAIVSIVNVQAVCLRIEVNSLTLGSATGITITTIGKDRS